MKLAILIGPHAVGKMTVGQHLSELSGYKLFHNHLSIELVAPFFSFSTPEGRGLVNDIRQLFFEAFAKSDAAGYILTFVWAFELSGEREYIESSEKHRLNSHAGELDFPKYLRINNTHKSAMVVAKQIWEYIQSRE